MNTEDKTIVIQDYQYRDVQRFAADTGMCPEEAANWLINIGLEQVKAEQ